MEEKKKLNIHHKHVSLSLIIIIGLIIFMLILIKPAMLGYKLSKEFEEINMTPTEILVNLEQLKSKIKIADQNIETCNNLNDKYITDISTEKDSAYLCEQKLLTIENSIQDTKRNYTSSLNEIDAQLQESQFNYQNIIEQYDTLSVNSANNICCKQKVDDPSIDSFKVINNKIICTINGEEKINC